MVQTKGCKIVLKYGWIHRQPKDPIQNNSVCCRWYDTADKTWYQ